MKLPNLLACMSVCLLFAAPTIANSQTKMDADGSDIAAMEKKIAYAHEEKIDELQAKKDYWAKSCRTGKRNTIDQDASEACARFVGLRRGSSEESILLKGCSYTHTGNPASNSCLALGEFYVDTGRDIEALAVLKSPNAASVDRPDESDRQIAGIRYAAYNALGNAQMARHELQDLCYKYGAGGGYTENGNYGAGSCGLLRRLGESVDIAAANERWHEWQAERHSEGRQRAADEAEDKAEKAQRHQEMATLAGGLADTAVSSYGDYQAGMAQARVNAETVKLAQQNKGAGGYPTTSSGGSSSGSSSSSTSSNNSVPKDSGPMAASDSSQLTPATDSSDDSSGSSGIASNSDKTFNPYSSTVGGYNPYSVQGVPAAGSSIAGEQGHWVDTEMTVTCYSKDFPNTLISAVLVSGPGEPNCNGAFVEFSNPDRTHSFYYGFAGVINERMEANSTRDIRWPAPYLYKDRPNPAFVATVSIRYFAAY